MTTDRGQDGMAINVEELNETKRRVWNDVLTLLGIDPPAQDAPAGNDTDRGAE